VLQDLFQLLRETKQETPQWFSEMVYQNRREPFDKRRRVNYNNRDYRRSEGNRDSSFKSHRYNEGRYYNRDRDRDFDRNKDREREKDNWEDSKDWKRDNHSDKTRSFNTTNHVAENKLLRPFVGDTGASVATDANSKWNFAGGSDAWGS